MRERPAGKSARKCLGGLKPAASRSACLARAIARLRGRAAEGGAARGDEIPRTPARADESSAGSRARPAPRATRRPARRSLGASARSRARPPRPRSRSHGRWRASPRLPTPHAPMRQGQGTLGVEALGSRRTSHAQLALRAACAFAALLRVDERRLARCRRPACAASYARTQVRWRACRATGLTPQLSASSIARTAPSAIATWSLSPPRVAFAP